MMLLICKLALPLLFLGGGSPRRVFSYKSITLGFFWQKKGWERKWLFFLITIAFSLHIFICMIFFQSYACTSVFGGLREGVSPYRAITVEVFTKEWLRK